MIYTTTRVKGLLRIYNGYLAEGILPHSDRAADERSRGHVEFESKPPSPASDMKSDIDRALQTLDRWEMLCVRVYQRWPAMFDDPKPGKRRATKKQMRGLDDACVRMVEFLNGGWVPTEAEEALLEQGA